MGTSIGGRWLNAVVGVGLVAAACTSSTTEETTTSVSSVSSTSTSVIQLEATTTLDPALGEPLPVDSSVRIGILENGLSYFIRFNDSPGGRAELRLAVDAGSLYEDADQSGVAHFLEHMMFNGTEQYPHNELVAILEMFGPQFGPDINAFTSFDETVYQLSLVAESDVLDLGMNVLREWATEATITETDVTEERGVVFEERRIRDEGLAGRISAAIQDLVLSGTPYEGKAPIGTMAAIESMTPDVLSRFYSDWYRPDNMAVIAVGDFDIDQMEQRITDAFETIAGSESPRSAPVGGSPTEGAVQAAVLADPEIATTSIDVMWPRAVARIETVGDRQNALVLGAAMSMLATRLNDDSLRGDVPLLGVSQSTSGFARAFDLPTLSARARPDATADAINVLATELARVRIHGFSDQEFAREMEQLTAAIELDYESRETAQDQSYASSMVLHYLAGTPLMDHKSERDIDTGIIDRMTKDLVESTFLEFLEATNPLVFVSGPDDADGMPEPSEIESLFAAPADADLEPHRDVDELQALMTTPDPVFTDDATVDEELGYLRAVFPNGATVMVFPTTIAENLVTVEIVSFGGSSVVPVGDVPEASLISQMVGRSGLGPADPAMLRRFLADRTVSVSPWISETREGISATAATDDLEVMMQLIHLMMTEPRADRVAIDNVIAEYVAEDAVRDDVPRYVVSDALDHAYYSGDPRYVDVLSAGNLSDFDDDRALEIFRERFGNAGDFVFAIVGDFEFDAMGGLVTEYIATLPGTDDREQFVDNQPLPPREVQILTVEAGTDPQGELSIFFTNEFSPSLEDRLTGQVLELIVNARLRDRIREALSATYSPRAGISLQRDPDPFVEAHVIVSGDPDRLEEISQEVLADLADLATNGPTEAEFETAVEQLITEIGLVNNPQIASALTNSYLYPDEPASFLIDRYGLIPDVSAGDVRRLARITYSAKQRIEIRQVPVGG